MLSSMCQHVAALQFVSCAKKSVFFCGSGSNAQNSPKASSRAIVRYFNCFFLPHKIAQEGARASGRQTVYAYTAIHISAT